MSITIGILIFSIIIHIFQLFVVSSYRETNDILKFGNNKLNKMLKDQAKSYEHTISGLHSFYEKGIEEIKKKHKTNVDRLYKKIQYYREGQYALEIVTKGKYAKRVAELRKAHNSKELEILAKSK